MFMNKINCLKTSLGLDKSLAPEPAVRAAQKMLGIKAQSRGDLPKQVDDLLEKKQAAIRQV